jgi:hypothetical protein
MKHETARPFARTPSPTRRLQSKQRI